jgi:hypothetical protein
MERNERYEDRYGTWEASQRTRGEAAVRRGAGGVGTPLAAPQPRMGSPEGKDHGAGMVAMGRGAGRAAALLGAPPPGVGMRNGQDYDGAHGGIVWSRGSTLPPGPTTTCPLAPLQPGRIRPLTMAQTYAVATGLPPDNDDVWQTQLSKQHKQLARKAPPPFVPAKDLPVEARRLIFSRRTDSWASPKPDQEFTAAINDCL